MRTDRTRAMLAALTLLLVAGCDHSIAFSEGPTVNGPRTSGPDVQLTYNNDQDYWPTYTADGRGIMYSSAYPSFFTAGNFLAEHRCINMLPAQGGTIVWSLCDNRQVASSSSTSFPAYALDGSGQLLYAEAVSPPGETITLWLADTAHPFNRKALLTLPVILGGITYNWISELHWTTPTSFVALAQLHETFAACHTCSSADSLWDRGKVVVGTIAAGGATLAAVSGTDNATDFSLAEQGASIVFTTVGDQRLFQVPVAGGPPTVIATVTTNLAQQLTGVACQGTTCVVADNSVVFTDPGIPIFPSIPGGLRELQRVDLTTGAVTTLRSDPLFAGAGADENSTFNSPQISPVDGSIVVQVGGTWGHIQTFTLHTSNLHLLAGALSTSERHP